MLGIILTGHGQFASGMAGAVEVIAGKIENLVIVDFMAGDSSESLEKNLKDGLEQLQSCSTIVILTDLMGGTPFKTAAMLSLEYKNCTVIYGTNLSMILELCLSEESENDVDKLADKVIQIGKNQIDKFQLLPQNDNEFGQEGI